MADKISGTHIRLMSGIPFNSDYKHTRYFTNRSSQTSYFDSFTTTYRDTQSNFIRTEGRFRYRVKENIENLHNTNYIRFFNQRPNGSDSRRIYGFVTRMEYVNIQATDIFFEIDVIQTYLMDCTWKHSFVNREHMNFFLNFSDEANYNDQEIPTVDEGLYYGEEYETHRVEVVQNEENFRWLVIVATDPIHNTDDDDIPPSYIINPTPLYYYVIPFLPSGIGLDISINNGDGPVWSISDPDFTIEKLYQSEQAVGKVVSMYVTEDIGVRINGIRRHDGPFVDIDYNGRPADPLGTHEFENVDLVGDPSTEGDSFGSAIFVKRIMEFVPNTFRIYDNFWNQIQDVPGNAETYTLTEHKVLTSPYHWIELHDYRGNMVKIRPEFIKDNRLAIVRKGSLGNSNKVAYNIRFYGHDQRTHDFRSNFEHEHALIDNNPNDIAIKNEHLASFLQGNRNQLNHQVDHATIQGAFSVINGGIGVSAASDPSLRAYGIQGGSGAPGIASSISGGAEGLAESIMTIKGQQAKKQDIANMPSSLSKMGGNTEFDFGYGFTGVFVVIKGIKQEYRGTINDFFHAFGYKSNRLKVPNTTTRRRFNFVHTNEANIVGNINNTYIRQLKNIFNSGITLWHVNNVADYSGNNGPR